MKTVHNSCHSVWLNPIQGPYCGQPEKLAAEALFSRPTVTKQLMAQLARCSQSALEIWQGGPCLTLLSASGNPALYSSLVSLPEPVSLYAGLVIQATVGAGSRGMYVYPAAPRGLGHLCKATLTAVAFTPRWHLLQRKLSHHLEPGSSWEGDETLAEVVAKTTPKACARSS